MSSFDSIGSAVSDAVSAAASSVSSVSSTTDDTVFIYDEDATVYENSNNMFSAYVNLKRESFESSMEDLDELNDDLTTANEYFALFVDFAAQDETISIKDEMSYSEWVEFYDWMNDETDIDVERYFSSSHGVYNLYYDDDGGIKDDDLSKSEVQGLKAAIDTHIKSLEADQSKQSIEVNQYLTRMNEGLGWWGGKLDSFDRLWSKITGNI